MRLYSSTFKRILDAWPGKKLGIYRFLPIFFVLGAGLEFSMIHWSVGETNFCKLKWPKIYNINQFTIKYILLLQITLLKKDKQRISLNTLLSYQNK